MELISLKQPRVLPRHFWFHVIKRMIDVTICLLILPVAIPLIALCALIIYLDSSGPVFFVQERIGKGGRLFRLYKFRTLCTDLDQDYCQKFMKAYVKGELSCLEGEQETFKPIRAQQITRSGRILRKTSLDELPQIINVLKGEMSLVGPRPNVLWEVEAYHPWHHERLEVLPGITGLAQVNGRSCINFASLVRHDIEYIERQSLTLDLQILWRTATSILCGKGAS